MTNPKISKPMPITIAGDNDAVNALIAQALMKSALQSYIDGGFIGVRTK
ncbi:uncharacterized protein YukJ [Rhizobium sp. SG_E_25_P2]|nr:hypothetical protein [Rhizobium sp. SG_E_25_P2]MDH6268261.1 uncharacterized protein YukJ [Rhizobium sp. SG_E_25_P2]